MEITSREIATIIPALECWKEELAELDESIPNMLCFQKQRPLSEEEVDELIARLRNANSKPPASSDYSEGDWKLNLNVPTYVGSQKARGKQPPDAPDFTGPYVPILILPAAGVRLVLGTHDYEDRWKPDIQIERRPRGWAIFLHPSAGDPVGCVFILDDGRTFLVPERFISQPIEIVDDIPSDLDAP